MTQAMTRSGSDAARARLAQSAVAYAFGVTQDELEAPTRRSREVAQAFGRDRSTAAHACHRIEDQRDDRGFDEYMDALEACLRAAPCPGEPA